MRNFNFKFVIQTEQWKRSEISSKIYDEFFVLGKISKTCILCAGGPAIGISHYMLQTNVLIDHAVKNKWFRNVKNPSNVMCLEWEKCSNYSPNTLTCQFEYIFRLNAKCLIHVIHFSRQQQISCPANLI